MKPASRRGRLGCGGKGSGGRLSTDFSCFDSALRSMDGRWGGLACFLNKSRESTVSENRAVGHGRRCAAGFGPGAVCRGQGGGARKPGRYGPGNRLASTLSFTRRPASSGSSSASESGKLSTDFSCFDSAPRSVYGRCGGFAYSASRIRLRNARGENTAIALFHCHPAPSRVFPRFPAIPRISAAVCCGCMSALQVGSEVGFAALLQGRKVASVSATYPQVFPVLIASFAVSTGAAAGLPNR